MVVSRRYAHLSGFINDVILLIEEDGTIVEANDRAASTYGYDIDELLRLNIRDLIATPEQPPVSEVLEGLKKNGAMVFESVHRRQDGSTLQVEVSSRRVNAGARTFNQSIIRDITERKRNEEEVRRASRAMRVLSASNQALVRSQDEASLFRAICSAATEAGGYPLVWIGFAQNDEQKSVMVMASSSDRPEYLESLQVSWADAPLGRGPTGTCIRAGRIAICNNTGSDPAFEPWRESALQYGYRSVIALPLYVDAAVIGALTIYANEPDAFQHEEMSLLQELAGDLSYGIEGYRRSLEQARTQRALLQSAMEFRTLFDNVSDAIFITDLEGRILEVNQPACERLGYSHDELLKMTVQDIDSPAFTALETGRVCHLIDHGESLYETVHVRNNGAEVPVEISSRLFYYRCAPAILNVARDIRDRKIAEIQARKHAAELERAKTEAETANQAKSQFLANMSHEIRTPMNGIIGMSGLLLDTALSPAQREYAQTICTSAHALLAIVNDVLDFSKIEAGRMDIERGRFDILGCLDEVGELMAPQARAKGLTYVFQASVENRWVIGDSGRLRQIVLNLLGNAIKFTEKGQVTLRISDGLTSDGHGRFTLTIADTGIGIAEQDLPLLFQKFTQVDSSLSKKHQGTGLGLAISRRLAELMGGTLSASSVLGQGSTFVLKLTLPLAPELGPATRGTRAEPEVPDTPLTAKPRRVLLAEDNVVNQTIGRRLLEKFGCSVDVAANGKRAVEMAAGSAYDIIFMDCGMPEMDGFTATQEIRATEIHARRIPIIALTAHVMAGTREECLAAGMDDYIAKPVSLDAIKNTLAKWAP